MVGAGEKLPAVQVHLLILGAAGTAADGHITQVCPHQSGFEIVSAPPAYSRYPANGRPRRRRDHIPARAPDAEPECFPGVPHSRLERRGLPPSGSQHQNRCLHVVEYNGHGISRQQRRRRARTGRQTAGGRPAQTRRLMGQSATPALPGSGATLPDAAQTALSRDQHGYGNIHRVTLTLHQAIPHFNGR